MDAAASTWHKPPSRRQPTDLLARQDQASSKGPITTEMATCGFWDGGLCPSKRLARAHLSPRAESQHVPLVSD
ncbi:hypothetical protein MCOR27_009785 [Pyricularia oryzae]|uniref:Uncharacterized protein n=1 Tax=Pyricularia grisea TaxID=148305 RepID=A0ABQ8NUS6_PYRGI|nr:hypothetical protein MCOR01_006903 [Pyricularia oryzae]KAI6302403.1 hypothetical protein MCOR33_002300 [Pyricularia grisea]KAI6258194.1 hypothetical protein MCOR19_005441 [Pyricularia oryzae]KAI6269313.1 hypothetical protein MCOR27_009785 [Pyricularia oryzae]KAI6282035.1 hypothetical protein MCOR26_002984 [Pyricularia oryzae]